MTNITSTSYRGRAGIVLVVWNYYFSWMICWKKNNVRFDIYFLSIYHGPFYLFIHFFKFSYTPLPLLPHMHAFKRIHTVFWRNLLIEAADGRHYIVFILTHSWHCSRSMVAKIPCSAYTCQVVCGGSYYFMTIIIHVVHTCTCT